MGDSSLESQVELTEMSAGVSPPFSDLDTLRSQIDAYVQAIDYESAIFWARYIYEISDQAEDCQKLIECLIHAKQFNRALSYQKNVDYEVSLTFRLLFAHCFFNTERYDQALDLLLDDREEEQLTGMHEDNNDKENDAKNRGKGHMSTPFGMGGGHGKKRNQSKMMASKYVLMGQIYDIQQNPNVAFSCLRQALAHDPYCAAAWQQIKRRKYLSANDQADFYKIHKLAETPENQPIAHSCQKRHADSALSTLSKASALFEKQLLTETYQITSRMIYRNAFDWDTLPLHLATIVEMGSSKSTELFKISHNLMDACPQRSISWYAAGCYYFCIGNLKQARHHFSRATEFVMDEYICWASWIGYAHSFAKDFEHDQALAAYLQASQLMPNNHLPNLYIGMQHLSNNNFKLAEQYFDLAAQQSRCGSEYDPFVLSEQAYTCYLQSNYDQSEVYAKRALTRLDSCYCAGPRWATVLANLGHTFRKRKNYKSAEACFEKALILDPSNAENLYTAIGLVKLHLSAFESAIEYLQKALVMNSKNEHAAQLLQDAMELWSYEMNIIAELPDIEELDKSKSSLDNSGSLVPMEETESQIPLLEYTDDNIATPSTGQKVQDSVDNMSLEEESDDSD